MSEPFLFTVDHITVVKDKAFNDRKGNLIIDNCMISYHTKRSFLHRAISSIRYVITIHAKSLILNVNYPDKDVYLHLSDEIEILFIRSFRLGSLSYRLNIPSSITTLGLDGCQITFHSKRKGPWIEQSKQNKWYEPELIIPQIPVHLYLNDCKFSITTIEKDEVRAVLNTFPLVTINGVHWLT